MPWDSLYMHKLVDYAVQPMVHNMASEIQALLVISSQAAFPDSKEGLDTSTVTQELQNKQVEECRAFLLDCIAGNSDPMRWHHLLRKWMKQRGMENDEQFVWQEPTQNQPYGRFAVDEEDIQRLRKGYSKLPTLRPHDLPHVAVVSQCVTEPSSAQDCGTGSGGGKEDQPGSEKVLEDGEVQSEDEVVDHSDNPDLKGRPGPTWLKDVIGDMNLNTDNHYLKIPKVRWMELEAGLITIEKLLVPQGVEYTLQEEVDAFNSNSTPATMLRRVVYSWFVRLNLKYQELKQQGSYEIFDLRKMEFVTTPTQNPVCWVGASLPGDRDPEKSVKARIITDGMGHQFFMIDIHRPDATNQTDSTSLLAEITGQLLGNTHKRRWAEISIPGYPTPLRVNRRWPFGADVKPPACPC